MVHLSDADRRPLHLPLVTGLIIVVNVVVFLIELVSGDAFISRWALVPADITAGHDWTTVLIRCSCMVAGCTSWATYCSSGPSGQRSKT